MSLASKAEKNIAKLAPRLSNIGSLDNIPIVLTDSKGKYFRDQCQDRHPDKKIVWWIHPGTGVQQNLQWLKEKTLRTFQDLVSVNFFDAEYDSEIEFGIRPVTSPDTPLLPLPVSISPLSQYSEHSLETDYPGSYLSDEFLSLNQLSEPDITYLLTPSQN
ncbi:unnamed protein product [Mytilus coruscus]|uniref:Uncharacterized protein n=1 Tax=Mytilus coruscus TaxID=42192 RepID=A0A6J8E4C0_MYTCO|nr:unnamed protein product [Mytilus coruscus]